MTTYYWVASGAGTFTDSANWSLTSGGAGGAGVPTSSDDVVFDGGGATGKGTLTCRNLTSQTPGASFSGESGGYYSNINVYGNFGGEFISILDEYVLLNIYGSGTHTLQFRATTIYPYYRVTFDGAGSFTLNSDLDCLEIRLRQGTINFNGFTIETEYLYILGSDACAIDMNWGTFNITPSSSSCINIVHTNYTFDGSDGTINIYASADVAIYLDGITINEFNLVAYANGVVYSLYESATYGTFTINTGYTQTISFSSGTTHTFTNATISGVAGKVLTLECASPTSQYNMAKSGGGTITIDRATISGFNGSPSDSWFATNSSDAGYNDGIDFGVVGSGLFMFGTF